MSRASVKILVRFLLVRIPHGEIRLEPGCIGRAGASNIRRLLLLVCVGWLPPELHPSGTCLARGMRVSCSLFTPSRIAPHRGCASSVRLGGITTLAQARSPKAAHIQREEITMRCRPFVILVPL